jgi:hypothetical protein
MDIEAFEVYVGGVGDALQALSHHVGGILGRIAEHGSRLPSREVAQAGAARSDRNGKIKGKEGFTALGLTADDTNGFFAPQTLNQPSRLSCLWLSELRGTRCWKWGDRIIGETADIHISRELSM